MNRKFYFLMLLVATVVMGCSKDDDDKQTPVEEKKTGTTMSVTVVFAPSQLGDMGFADNVMEGIYRLKALDHQLQPDSLDVSYLTGENVSATIQAAETWFENPYSPYTGEIYNRRLLVLTEPYMIDWIEPHKVEFLDNDEVLVLKMNEADVAASAKRLDLGKRLHGINISAASSALRYCQYILETIDEAEEEHKSSMGEDGTDADDLYKPLNCEQLLFFRLNNPEKVTPRDSLVEVIGEQLADMAKIVTKTITKTEEDGQSAVLEEAYKYGQETSELYESTGSAFHIADLGSAGQGMNYYFLGYPEQYPSLLMLDTQSPSHFWVRRDFGTAVYHWGIQWMRSAEVGTMPAIQEFGSWNSNYVTDNIDLNDE